MLVLREVEGNVEIILQVVSDDLILTTGIINQPVANVQLAGGVGAHGSYLKISLHLCTGQWEQPDNYCDLLTVSPN